MKRFIPLLLAAVFIGACDKETTGADGPEIVYRDALPRETVYITDTLVVTPPPKYDITDIDSLMKLNFRLPSLLHENATGLMDQFYYLAENTEGQHYFVDSAAQVTKTILHILDSNLADKTDLVFLIDNTGSMIDDITNVKQGTDVIIDHIRMRSDVRFGVATYGDNNVDGGGWYSYMPFTSDFTAAKDYISRIGYSGGGDYPESMFDGACLTMDTLEWREDSKKIVIVIGDAPGLLPPFSSNSMGNVIDKSKEHGVMMNYYPVIVAPFTGYRPDESTIGYKSQALVQTVYPLPSTGAIHLALNEEADYSWEVYNISGRMVKNGEGVTAKISLDLGDQRDGVYVVRIVNKLNRKFEEKKVIVAH